MHRAFIKIGGKISYLQGDYFTQQIPVMQNDCGMIQDRRVRLRFEAASPCVFTRGLAFMDLPFRHGEVKVLTLDI